LKKILLPLLVLALVFSINTPPVQVEASKLDELNKKLKQLEAQAIQSEKTKKNAESEIKSINSETKVVEKEINELNSQIENTKKEIALKEQEIEKTKTDLQQTAQALDEAEQRVADRDSLLRSRVRLMYTSGSVSYLDVLFNSTSFADFLDRYRALSQIVDQDKHILEADIEDKNLIAANKAKIEVDVANLEVAYQELEDTKNSLIVKEKDKEVRIAQLQSRKEHLEEITEDEEKALTDFLKEKSKVTAEINKLKAEKHAGKYMYPLPKDFKVTSKFGYRIHPITKKKKLHTGTDFGAPTGTEVLAAGSGIVITAKFWGGYGNAVVIDHLNGQWTLYAHMSKILVKENDKVKMGETIGKVGNTGSSTGPHLHYEVRVDSVAVDAMKYTNPF
jgi:murein DD-endopeptidase MepM/ murein hydrolase activator NlpD